MPGARRTRGLVCKMKNTRVSHHRYAETSGIPCAMVLTVSFVLFSVTGLFCHRHSCNAARIITSLMPASGHQDHTTSPSASARLVFARRRVHRIPHPTFVTIAKRPSAGRDARSSEGDLAPNASRTFLAAGLDTDLSDLPVGLIRRDVCCRGSMHGGACHTPGFTMPL
jgi:hypothetical protein